MPDEKDPAEEKSLEALEPVPSEPRLQPTPSPAFISLLDHVDNLWSTFDIAFKRVFVTNHAVDHIVFFYGRRSIEDFSEILLLCQHGYGKPRLLRRNHDLATTRRPAHRKPNERPPISGIFTNLDVIQTSLFHPVENRFAIASSICS
jgi:hypothetical protein